MLVTGLPWAATGMSKEWLHCFKSEFYICGVGEGGQGVLVNSTLGSAREAGSTEGIFAYPFSRLTITALF